MTYIYILLVLILLALVFLILKNKKNTAADISSEFFNQFNQKFPEILNQANTNLINLANEKVSTDLDNEVFVKYGGHEGAFGCNINKDKFLTFKDLFNNLIESKYENLF